MTAAQARLRLTDGAGFDLPDDLLIAPHVLCAGADDGAFWVRATRLPGSASGGGDGSSNIDMATVDPGGLARWRLGCHGLFTEMLEPAAVADAAALAATAYAPCDTTGDGEEGRRAAAAWLAATTAAAGAARAGCCLTSRPV